MVLNKPADLKSDELFGAVMATAVDGIIVIDDHGIIQLYNSACEKLFGYDSRDVVGKNIKILMPHPYHEEHDGYLSNYRETGRKKIIGVGREVMGRRKDRSVFPMYLSVGEGRLAERQVFVGIIHDLTAIKSIAKLQEDTDRHLAQIVQSSDDAILSKTLGGLITSWNRSAERIFGYSADEVVGRHISILIPPERLAEEERILENLRAGRATDQFETVRLHKDGREILVSVSVSPVRDSAGSIVGASKLVRDITERKRSEARLETLESELEHVARLSTMAQMTAAIAHEINQPLTAIANYLNAARHTIASIGDEQSSKVIVGVVNMLEKAGHQALRAGKIVANLRGFVEKRKSEHKEENLNEVVEEALALCTVNTTDSRVQVRLELDSTLPPVIVDKIQIQQVLINLIRNSLEAMSTQPRRRLTISTGRDEPGFAQITVADTGPGLEPKVAARLFQPFVTTKDKGMGIGLAICQSIVENHGGRIWLLPHESTGTAFRIKLPLADQSGSNA